jgi:hypothetical protein
VLKHADLKTPKDFKRINGVYQRIRWGARPCAPCCPRLGGQARIPTSSLQAWQVRPKAPPLKRVKDKAPKCKIATRSGHAGVVLDGGAETISWSAKRWATRPWNFQSSGPPPSLAMTRCRKHCSGILRLDNAFVLIEGHPNFRILTQGGRTGVVLELRAEIVLGKAKGGPPAQLGGELWFSNGGNWD